MSVEKNKKYVRENVEHSFILLNEIEMKEIDVFRF